MRLGPARISPLAALAALGWLTSACAAGAPRGAVAQTAQLAAPISDAHEPGLVHDESPPEEAARRGGVYPLPQPPPEPAQQQPVDPFAEMLDPPRCPKEMTLIGEVCVDRWEASLVMLTNSGDEKPWSPFKSTDGAAVHLRAVSVPGVVPQGYISGDDAARACAASGKRLCTAGEWEAACRGPRRTTYPYGNERRRHTCNDDGRAKHPVFEVTKRLSLPKDRMWYEGMDHPLINQLDDTLRKTGERSECTNGYGAFDMVGNLHEWIDDPEGTFRGGFYMDTQLNGEGCNYQTVAHGTGYHDYSTGFRCCLDADSVE